MVEASDAQWSAAFARQALSDLRVRELLVERNAEKCHRLHFLQMAAEKACKAHLASTGYHNVRKTHACIAKTLPQIARAFYAKSNKGANISSHQVATINRLAQEIELLAPACGVGEYREDNSEYPWPDGKGGVRIPCQYHFPNLHDGSRAIVGLLKLIRTACESYI